MKGCGEAVNYGLKSRIRRDGGCRATSTMTTGALSYGTACRFATVLEGRIREYQFTRPVSEGLLVKCFSHY